MGWIFQGNPKLFDIDDYLARYPQRIYWRTPRYANDIKVDDRAFIWRSGTEAGAVAIGAVVELPVEAAYVQYPEAVGEELWIADPPDPGERKTGIQLQEIRLTRAEGMVPRQAVVADARLAGSTLIRVPQSTVFKLSELETLALERLWGSCPIDSRNQGYAEGDRRLRAHYVRERSPKLRDDKLAAFAAEHGMLHCELCGVQERGPYPHAFSRRVFEVHHYRPLSIAEAPVRTTLQDLVVLCANCHRAVHASSDVEQNYSDLLSHFSGST
jgi:hypothetical protein